MSAIGIWAITLTCLYVIGALYGYFVIVRPGTWPNRDFISLTYKQAMTWLVLLWPITILAIVTAHIAGWWFQSSIYLYLTKKRDSL